MEIILGNTKFHHIFTAGDYPQGKFTVADLHKIAAKYNTEKHEAPVWIGHNAGVYVSVGEYEPRAIGWVAALMVIDDKLFCSFSYVSPEFEYLTDAQIYKYCSAEFVKYFANDSWNFFALGLTNRPGANESSPLRVKALASFTESNSKNFNAYYVGEVATFNIELENFSDNQKSNQMNEQLKKIAADLGINVAAFTDESALAAAVSAKFVSLDSEVKDLKEKAGTETETGDKKPEQENANFAAQLAQIDTDRKNELIDSAVAQGKILEKDKPVWAEFAKSVKYDAFKNALGTLETKTVFAGGVITNGSKVTQEQTAAIEEAKFVKPGTNGETYTYEDVIKDPVLQAKFTQEEKQYLREKSAYKR